MSKREVKITIPVTDMPANMKAFIEAVTVIDAKMVRAMQRLAAPIQKFVDSAQSYHAGVLRLAEELRTSFEGLRYIIEPIVSSPYIKAIEKAAAWILEQERIEKATTAAVQQAGYFTTPTLLNLPAYIMPQLAAEYRSGRKRALDAFFAELYGPDSPILEQLSDHWRSCAVLSKRQFEHVEECLWAHAHRRYGLLICSLEVVVLSLLLRLHRHVESGGQTVRRVRSTGFPGFNRMLESLRTVHDSSETLWKKYDALAVDFIVNHYLADTRQFKDGVRTRLSRHAISHGTGFSCFNRKNSIRSFMLLEVLHDIYARISLGDEFEAALVDFDVLENNRIGKGRYYQHGA